MGFQSMSGIYMLFCLIVVTADRTKFIHAHTNCIALQEKIHELGILILLIQTFEFLPP